MKAATSLLLLSVLIGTATPAAERGWQGDDASHPSNTADQKTVRGFSGWLLVTPDMDWQQKWETPSDTTPVFNTADEVAPGDSLTILVFFAGPRTDARGHLRITCDIVVTRPDRSTSINEKGIDCASGPLQGPAAHLRLTNAVLNFVGEPGDPPGKWLVDVTLRDQVAKIALPLQTSFLLKPPGR